jgi:2-dehydropantoate 2-reductase
MTMQQNNIVIIGQGAMGLLWYHYLTQANTITNSGSHVSILSSNQRRFNSTKQPAAEYQFTQYNQKTVKTFSLNYAKAAEIKRANIILLCVKSYQIVSAIEGVAKNINPQCQVILAHNGMGTFEEVVKLLSPHQPILAMLTTHGCLRRRELSIEHTGLGHSDIGLLSGELSLSQQNGLEKLLCDALPTTTYHTSIANKQWLKLAINCVINPLTAINNIDNGKVNDDKYAEVISLLLTEISAISQKEGINLRVTDLQEMVSKVAQATAKNCSSMRCDVLANRQTEIDYINGFIGRLGKKYNIATPENTRLWRQIQNLNT